LFRNSNQKEGEHVQPVDDGLFNKSNNIKQKIENFVNANEPLCPIARNFED
jgi:hypothetical protein